MDSNVLTTRISPVLLHVELQSSGLKPPQKGARRSFSHRVTEPERKPQTCVNTNNKTAAQTAGAATTTTNRDNVKILYENNNKLISPSWGEKQSEITPSSLSLSQSYTLQATKLRTTSCKLQATYYKVLSHAPQATGYQLRAKKLLTTN